MMVTRFDDVVNFGIFRMLRVRCLVLGLVGGTLSFLLGGFD